MKKWIASAIAVSMILNNSLHGDAAPEINTEAQSEVQDASALPAAVTGIPGDTASADPAPLDTSQEEVYIEESQPEPPQFAEVGRGSSDAVKAASNRRWQRIGIAVGAVAIATIALILVSNNPGHNAH